MAPTWRSPARRARFLTLALGIALALLLAAGLMAMRATDAGDEVRGFQIFGPSGSRQAWQVV